MSDISSAGIARVSPGYRLTSGKYVLRGVDVPVVPGAARRARPVPRRQGQLGEQVPACGAGLRAGVPAVDHDERALVALALVLEHGPELAPSAVADDTGQLPVAGHPFDVQ